MPTDYLRGLYGVIKARDAHVRFTCVTGAEGGLAVSGDSKATSRFWRVPEVGLRLVGW